MRQQKRIRKSDQNETGQFQGVHQQQNYFVQDPDEESKKGENQKKFPMNLKTPENNQYDDISMQSASRGSRTSDYRRPGGGAKIGQGSAYANNRQDVTDPQQEDFEEFMHMRLKMNNSQFKRKSSQSVVMFNNNRAINDFKGSIAELSIGKKKSDRDAYDEDIRQQSGEIEPPIRDFQEQILAVQDSPNDSPRKIDDHKLNVKPMIGPTSQSRSSIGKQAQDISQPNFGINSDFGFDRDSIKSLSH